MVIRPHSNKDYTILEFTGYVSLKEHSQSTLAISTNPTILGEGSKIKVSICLPREELVKFLEEIK